MFRKFLSFLIIFCFFYTIGSFYLASQVNKYRVTDHNNIIKPLVMLDTEGDIKSNGTVSAFGTLTGLSGVSAKTNDNNASTLTKNSDINILLLGIDRRFRQEFPYRADIMILVSVNTSTNQVVLTSVPRDLWYQGERINAVFSLRGWEQTQKAFEEITGFKPTHYILTDFKDFEWLIDALGGVEIDVENTFVDFNYPVDETLEYQTVSFNQGVTKMNGSQALIFARSRKGNNGEGSDWARMKRQHLILRSIITALENPNTLFNPMVVENVFSILTNNKMDTNLTLLDAKYLWDFYKDKDKYTINSTFLNENYVFNPPMEDYGGAWVLAPINGNFNDFKLLINNKLQGITEIPSTTDPGSQIAI